jgi:hypothetical protein
LPEKGRKFSPQFPIISDALQALAGHFLADGLGRPFSPDKSCPSVVDAVQARRAELARATRLSAPASGGGDTAWKNRPFEFNCFLHDES